jgi:transposase
MGGKADEPLRQLSEQERRVLAGVAKATSERVDRVRRAQAVLAVAAGADRSAAARAAGFASRTSVSDLVRRFNQQGVRVLKIAPGRGRQPTYASAARARVVALAPQQPDRRQDGTATWSLSTLQKRLRKEGLVQIGTSTIRRVLEAAGSSYQKTRTWCPTGTAQRKRKAGVVTVSDPQTEQKRGMIERAYREAEAAGIALWNQDEAGPYQTKPYPGVSWAPTGAPRRQPHE